MYVVQQACMPAVNLALDDVNREKNLLPGFILKLHSNDSEVYDIFDKVLRKNHKKVTTIHLTS